MKIVLPTTRRYYWELGPFFEFFNLHWSEEQEVTVLGDGDPGLDFPNLHYVGVPGPLLTDGVWGAKKFSDGVRWHLRGIDDDSVLLLLTDYWLADPVDLGCMDRLVRWLEGQDDVIRLGVQRNWTLKHGAVKTASCEGIDYYECPPGNPHCFLLMSFYPALWKRRALLEVWRDGWDPWECETTGTTRLMTEFPHYRSVLAEPSPLRRIFASYSQPQLRQVYKWQVPDHLWPTVEKWMPGDFEVVLE